MRFSKQVALTGEAPIYPIELPDLVVGMNHLGWSTLSHGRFVLRRRSVLFWPLWILGQNLLHVAHGPTHQAKRVFEISYWLEAKIDESGGHRTLALNGRVPMRERKQVEALLDALHRGRRWLTRDGPLG